MSDRLVGIHSERQGVGMGCSPHRSLSESLLGTSVSCDHRTKAKSILFFSKYDRGASDFMHKCYSTCRVRESSARVSLLPSVVVVVVEVVVDSWWSVEATSTSGWDERVGTGWTDE